MNEYLPFIVVGITTGSVYAMAGVGLVLTYKTSGIFNFAHGAQAAVAAYVMYQFWVVYGWPWPVSAVISVVLVGLLGGLLLERMANVLATTPPAARISATVGLLVGLQGALVAIFGPEARPMAIFLPDSAFRLSNVFVRVDQVIVSLLALVLVIALILFSRTRLGASMQAVVDDPVLLGLQGINPARVRRAAWMIGSCFASVSGMLLAPTVQLDAGILTLLVFFAFGAAAVGSFDSLGRTYAGGLAIGVVSSLLTKEISATSPLGQLPSILPFVVLFVVLVALPKQLAAERGLRAIRPVLAPVRFAAPVRNVSLALAAVLALVAPHLVEATRVPRLTFALAFLILFASLGLIARTSNQISLCHMTLAGIGAAASVHLQGAGLPWGLAVLAAGLAVVPVGAMVAIPAIRLSGIYLAIATFGFGVLAQRLFYDSSFLFGADLQLRAPRPSGALLGATSDVAYYYVVLAVALACCALIVLVRRGRLGRMLRAMADSPTALDAHGANTNITKLLVFCLSAFLAGVAGALIGPVTGTAGASSFDFTLSFTLLAVLFIAGRQPILGPVIAALLFAVLPSYITRASFLDLQPVVFGIGAMIAALFGGRPLLAPLAQRMKSSRRAADRVRSLQRHGIAVGEPVS